MDIVSFEHSFSDSDKPDKLPDFHELYKKLLDRIEKKQNKSSVYLLLPSNLCLLRCLYAKMSKIAEKLRGKVKLTIDYIMFTCQISICCNIFFEFGQVWEDLMALSYIFKNCYFECNAEENQVCFSIPVDLFTKLS